MRMLKKHSLVGFFSSLLIHLAIAALLFVSVTPKVDSANSVQADVLDTSISMEMMMAMVMEEPEPVVEPEPEIEKEVVPDPTLKPEPPKKPEKPKKIEKKEKQKEKPKKERPKQEKPKNKPVQQQARDLPKGDREVVSNAEVNSHATSIRPATTNNPNLAGNGRSTDEAKAYQSALRREIERHKRYSQRAKMMRKQGVVKVSFTIGADGSITNPRVIESSGNEDLDASALTAVKRARSIGPRPANVSANMSVPITFNLIN